MDRTVEDLVFSRRHTACLLGLALVAVLLCAPVAAASPKQVTNQIGDAQTGELGGQFGLSAGLVVLSSGPRGIAVNRTGAGGVAAGTVYMIDGPNKRIQRFGPTGQFVSAFGWGVTDGVNEPQVCSQAVSCRKGTNLGFIREPMGIAVDQQSGVVYLTDRKATSSDVAMFGSKGAFIGGFGAGMISQNSEEFEFCTPQTGCQNAPSFFVFGQAGALAPNGVGGIAVDSTGNVYVADEGYARIDVFQPTTSGEFVTGMNFVRTFGWGVKDEGDEFQVCEGSEECHEGIRGSGLGQFGTASPSDVAVDSEGSIYALDAGNERLQKFNSTPEPVDAAFGATALSGIFGSGPALLNIATDPSTTPNHLLVSGVRASAGGKVAVAELDETGANALGGTAAHGEDVTATTSAGLAAAGAELGGNIYLSAEIPGVVRGALVLNERPSVEPVEDITGTTATFKGNVVSNEFPVKYRFEYSTDGKHWSSVPAASVSAGSQPGEIAVEQQATGLTGSQEYQVRLVQEREVDGSATSLPVAFTTLAAAPAILGPAISEVTDHSATFFARLNPQNEQTSYHFEYGTSDCFLGGCTSLPTAQANGGGLRLVLQSALGLAPETSYRVRLVATNSTGTTISDERTFETLAQGATLPDDRAYELVTPPDTGVLVPSSTGIGSTGFAGGCFDTYPVTSNGESMIFTTEPGTVPGMGGAGFNTLYRSTRTATGWTTEATSPTGVQAPPYPFTGCVSADHLFSVFKTSGEASAEAGLSVNGEQTFVVRVPADVVNPACSPEPGSEYEAVGCGSSLDPAAVPLWVSSGGSHIVFRSAVQLAPEGPPTGTEGLYDRSPGGPLDVVSLLPGEIPLNAGQEVQYSGVSPDGSMVAFKVGGNLYLRKDNAATVKAASRGGAAVGTTLTCSSTTPATTKTFRWLRNGAPIGGATSSTYTTTLADAGTAVQCQVFALNANTGATQTSAPAVVVDPALSVAPPVPPGNIAAPTATGATTTIPVPGPTGGNRTLTCNPGGWQGAPTFTYQWYKDGAAIAGATASTFVIAEASLTVAANYQCAVTGTNAGGAATKVSANRTTTPAPSPAAPVPNASTGSAVEPSFSGLTRNDEYLFYEQRGDLFSFNIADGSTTQLSTGNLGKFANVSEEGEGAYFVSTAVLTGSQQNSAGDVAIVGKSNLYGWIRGQGVAFIAVLAPSDVSLATGLSNWSIFAATPVTSERGRGTIGTRTTPDGSVFVFESAGDPTHVGNLAGKFQIYRYDTEDESLVCVSCPPIEETPGTASLQISGVGNSNKNKVLEALGNDLMHIQNVTEDGRKVFFETTGALVPADVNATWDVYEWKEGQQPYLISSGHSTLPSFLYGMSPDGHDVFFRTTDRLTAEDPSGVYSIYDARVGGGFEQAADTPPCQVDSCQGVPGPSPSVPQPGSQSVQESGNVKAKRPHCGKNKRRVKRKGHLVCVKKHKKHHHPKANTNRGAGR
jgi:hypothetical protein